jgi:hypothetical protein
MTDAIEVGIYSHNLSVSFHEVFEREEEDQINFYVNLMGCLDENNDDVQVAHVEGTIASLPSRVGKGIQKIFALEIGDHFYAYPALSPLYLANGCLSDRMWTKVGGDDFSTRVVYVDKVVVEKGFVSINLGAKLVIAAMNLIYKILQEELPVIAILGSHDGYVDRGETVRKYFKRCGFKPLKPKEELSHFLPISKIKTASSIEDVEVFFSQQKKDKE